jgi:hypothetical protein
VRRSRMRSSGWARLLGPGGIEPLNTPQKQARDGCSLKDHLGELLPGIGRGPGRLAVVDG